MIQNRMGQLDSPYVKARDMVKYTPTPGRPGCKTASGLVNTQCGHSPEFKKGMLGLMSESRSHQTVVHGGGNRQPEGPAGRRPRLETSGRSRRRLEGQDSAGSRQSIGRERHDQLAARGGPERDGWRVPSELESTRTGANEDGEGVTKRVRLKCMGLAGLNVVNNEAKQSINDYAENKPTLTMADCETSNELEDTLRQQQHVSVLYFIEFDGKDIAAKSVRVAAQ